MDYRPVLLILITLLVVQGAAAAFTVQAEAGETYIRWTWPANYTFDVYVDGTLEMNNTSINYIYVNELNANEEHRLDLMNVSNTSPYKTSKVRTTAPAGLIWICLIISLILSVLVIFLEGWGVILVGAVLEVCGFFGRAISYGHFGVDWLFIAFMVFAGVFIIKAIYEIGRGEIAWY